MHQITTVPVIGHEFLSHLPDDMIVPVVREGLPIFVAERNSRGGLSFKCPACKRKHHHKAGAGLRKPHCFAKPPVHPAGYYLLEAVDDSVVPVEKIKRSKVEAFLRSLGGKMFGIDYVKKDQTFRSLTGRLDVVAPLKGGENKVEALDRPYLTVYDVVAKGYRTVNLDTARRLRVNGTVYDVVD